MLKIIGVVGVHLNREEANEVISKIRIQFLLSYLGNLIRFSQSRNSQKSSGLHLCKSSSSIEFIFLFFEDFNIDLDSWIFVFNKISKSEMCKD